MTSGGRGSTPAASKALRPGPALRARNACAARTASARTASARTLAAASLAGLCAVAAIAAAIAAGFGAAVLSPAIAHASSPPAPVVVNASFDGLSSAEEVTDFGTGFAVLPPDTQLAVGRSEVVSVVNSAIEAYNRSGSALGTKTLNAIFGTPSGYYVTDPRAAYDGSTGQWLLSAVDFDVVYGVPGDTHVYVAISATGNPLGNWRSKVIASAPASSGLLYDQPRMGLSGDKVVLSWEVYQQSSGFAGEQVDVLQRSDLEAGSNVRSWEPPPNPAYFALVPAVAPSSPDQAFLVANNSDSALTGAQANGTVQLLTITGTPAAGNVAMWEAGVPIPPTERPPAATQPGGAPVDATNDDRFLSAIWQSGTLTVTGNTACVPSGDATLRACARVISVYTPAHTLLSSVNFGIAGDDVAFAAPVRDGAGDLFLVYSFSSGALYPSVGAVAMAAGASGFGAPVTLAAGTVSYDCGSGCNGGANGQRFGDYSGAVADPSYPGAVWVAGEYTPDASYNWDWGTRVSEISLGDPVTSVSPSSGPPPGGTHVTIDGAAFSGAPTVDFGANPATGVTVVSPNEITAVAPAGSPGRVDVTVTVSGVGTSATTADDGFLYVAPGATTSVSPVRLVDTRSGATDPPTYAGRILGPGASLTFPVTGSHGVPANASAVVLNVTAIGPSAWGYLTVYPAGVAPPGSSSVNFSAGERAVANFVEVPVGEGGADVVGNAFGTTDVAVDLEGYVAPAGGPAGLFHPVHPVRVADTRRGATDPATYAGRTLGPGASLTIPLAGVSGLPASGMGAVAITLTGLDATSAGAYLTAYPAGSAKPDSSTVNFGPGPAVPNEAVIGLGGSNESLSVTNALGEADVLVDVVGWYTNAAPGGTGLSFQAVSPSRIADSRSTAGNTYQLAGHRLSPGAAATVTVGGWGSDGIPASAQAVQANLTVTDTASNGGYLTAWPAGGARPGTSNVNWYAGQSVADGAASGLGTGAAIEVEAGNSACDVIVDVAGYYA